MRSVSGSIWRSRRWPCGRGATGPARRSAYILEERAFESMHADDGREPQSLSHKAFSGMASQNAPVTLTRQENVTTEHGNRDVLVAEPPEGVVVPLGPVPPSSCARVLMHRLGYEGMPRERELEGEGARDRRHCSQDGNRARRTRSRRVHITRARVCPPQASSRTYGMSHHMFSLCRRGLA